jgi:hypothetical protein
VLPVITDPASAKVCFPKAIFIREKTVVVIVFKVPVNEILGTLIVPKNVLLVIDELPI